MEDKVCILLATYNGEKYLKEQLESILNQTYKNFVVLISDDASQDNTANIIRKYMEEFPDKIYYLGNDKKGGAVENFSFLLKNSINADYYMFSDQDDIWCEDKVIKSINRIRSMKMDGKSNCLVYCDAELVDENEQIVAKSFLKNSKFKMRKENRKTILVSSFAPGAAMIFDAELYELVKNMPREAHIHDWWVLLNAVYFGNIEFMDEQLYEYRQHSNNVYGAGLIRNKNGIINFIKNNTILNTLKRLSNQTNELQLKQKEMVKAFYEQKKSLFNNENEDILTDFLELYNNKSRLKRLFIIFKQGFYSISLLDNVLYIWNIVRRNV